MYDELIKRLRVSCEDCKLWDGYRCCLKCDCTAQTRLQAADAIEHMQKTILRLEDELGIYDDLPMVDQRESLIPWIYADIDTIIDSYSEPPKEET